MFRTTFTYNLKYRNLFFLFIFCVIFNIVAPGALASGEQGPSSGNAFTFRRDSVRGSVPDSIIHIKGGLYLFCNTFSSSFCELVDASTGKTRPQLLRLLHLTPDKKYAIVKESHFFRDVVTVYSVESGKRIASLSKDEEYVDAYGDKVLSFNSKQGNALLYAITSTGFKSIAKLPFKSKPSWGYILSGGSKILLSTKGVAIVWSATNGARMLEVRAQAVLASPTPDREYLAVTIKAGGNCEFLSYDASSMAEVARYKQDRYCFNFGELASSGLLPNNNYYLGRDGNIFHFYALRHNAVYTHNFDRILGYMLPVVLSYSGKTAILCDRVDTCYLIEPEYSIDSYRAIKNIHNFRYTSNSSDSLLVIRGQPDGVHKCQLYKPFNGNHFIDFGECSEDINAHGISEDGRYLLIVNGSIIKLWDDAGTKVKELHHDSKVVKTDIVLIKNMLQVLAVTADGYVYLWNIPKRKYEMQ